MSRRRYIDPQDFRDLRRFVGLTRREAAQVLDVTARTIQNWETGGARVPWLAYRMLRILRGYALPGKDWEGWTVQGDTLTAPNGCRFTANEMQHIEQVFSMARLWRQEYTAKRRRHPAVVLSFPEQGQGSTEAQKQLAAHPEPFGRVA